ncbi:hypothetical protein FRC05_009081, partial [Tulasnella sp. 425]
IVFSPDGGVLACGLVDATVRLLDAQTGAQLGDPLTGDTQPIKSVAFSPDSKVLASALHDGTVRLWDARTGAQLGDPLVGHINSVAFSPEDKVLAQSVNGTLRLWDPLNRQTSAGSLKIFITRQLSFESNWIL